MIERSLCFGDAKDLVGTLCLPDSTLQKTSLGLPGIVLFNAGIVHRVGPHRINVKLARELARVGIASIRFDLAGLGDSAPPGAGAGFEAQAVQDIRTAMTVLGEAGGIHHFGLFGFCSGAYHSFNTAQADERVAGLLLFEGYRYGTVRSHIKRVLLRFREQGIWPNLLRIVRRMSSKLRFDQRATASAHASSPGFIVDATTKQSFARATRHLLERGVTLSMVFAGDGFEVYNYPRQFHDAFRHLGIANRVAVTFLPDIDHVATGIAAQGELVGHIVQWAASLGNLQFAPGSIRKPGSALHPVPT